MAATDFYQYDPSAPVAPPVWHPGDPLPAGAQPQPDGGYLLPNGGGYITADQASPSTITPTGGFKGWMVNPDGSWSIDPSYVATPGQTSSTGVPSTNYAPPAGAPAAKTDTTTPPPTGGTSTTGGALGGLLSPFGGTYTQPPPVDLGGPPGIPYIPPVPTLNLPSFPIAPKFSYQDFTAPTLEEAQNDPGYQLARQEGQSGIESSAAARGLVRSGGTLNDILKYNSNFANSHYNDVLNRDLGIYNTNRSGAVNTYNTNYQTQYKDPYTFDVAAKEAEFAPQLSQWQTQAQAGQRQTEDNNATSWQQFLQKFLQFQDQRDSTFNKTFTYANA